MLTAVVTRGLAIEVTFVAAEEGEGELMSYQESLDFCEFPYATEDEYLAEAEAEHPCLDGPSPLAIETKELAWGAGAFIVLLVATTAVLRYRWGVVIGWVWQAALIACGILMPLMYAIGVGFALLWIWCFNRGRRIDAARTSGAANRPATDPDPSNEGETP